MAPSTNNQRNVVFVDGIRTPFGKAGPKACTPTRAQTISSSRRFVSCFAATRSSIPHGSTKLPLQPPRRPATRA